MNDSWKIPGGGNSFPFDNFGDYVTGLVFEFEPNLQQTDKEGKPKTFAGGQPMLMHRVGLHVLESSSPSHQQGVDASVYLKGGAKLNPDGSGPTQAVVLAAIKEATGLADLQPGAKLTLQYVADGPQKDRMTQPAKWYKAWYVPPKMNAAPGAASSAGPTQAPPPGAAAAGPAPTSAMPPAGATPGSPPAVADATPGLTPEEEAELAAMMAAEAEPDPNAWEQDPRVAPLRAKGVKDDMIRKVLKI